MILVSVDFVDESAISSMRRFRAIEAARGLMFLNEELPGVATDLAESETEMSSLGESTVDDVLLSLELFGDVPSTTIESDDVELVDVFGSEQMTTSAKALVGVLASIGGRTANDRMLLELLVVGLVEQSSKLRLNSVI